MTSNIHSDFIRPLLILCATKLVQNDALEFFYPSIGAIGSSVYSDENLNGYIFVRGQSKNSHSRLNTLSLTHF